MATRTILDLYNDYKRGYSKLKRKKARLMQDEEKNKEKIKLVNDEMIKFQTKYLKLWTNLDEVDKNE